MGRVSHVVGLLMLLGALVPASFAAQPPRFNYQARLTDSGGVPLQGIHTVFFRLFQGGSANSGNSGTVVFEEAASLQIVNGVTNHTIGTGTTQTFGPLTADMLRTSGDVFVQVEVDTPGNFILPRQRLESVPYSILSADGDARVPVSQPGSFPIVLDKPGSYYLTGNITGVSGQHGILISTGSVTLDLNGYSMIGVPGSLTAINNSGGPTSLSISNGTLRGWTQAVDLPACNDANIRDLKMTGNQTVARFGQSFIVENCIAESNTALGTAAFNFGANGIARNCIAANNQGPTPTGFSGGNTCMFENCIVRGNQGDDFDAIKLNFAGIARRCLVISNSTTAGDFVGIRAQNSSRVEECTILDNTAINGQCSGIVTGSSVRVLNCSCTDNISTGTANIVAGIYSQGLNCEIAGNLCASNRSEIPGATAAGIICSSRCYVHNNTCNGNTSAATGSSPSRGIAADGACRIENNHCTNHSGSSGQAFGIVINLGATGSTVIKNTTTANATAGLRFANTSGANYFAENVIDEATSISLAVGGANVAGTGDRSNVAF